MNDQASRGEDKKSYGAKVSFEIADRDPFEGEVVGEFCLVTKYDVIITIKPRGDWFRVAVESFERKEEAEKFGELIVDALLWGSLVRERVLFREENAPLRMEDMPHYSNGKVIVYDIQHEKSDHIKDYPYGKVSHRSPLKGQIFLSSMVHFLNDFKELGDKIRTAIEIYSS